MTFEEEDNDRRGWPESEEHLPWHQETLYEPNHKTMKPTYQQKPIFQNVMNITDGLCILSQIYFTFDEAEKHGKRLNNYAFTISTDVTVYNVEEVDIHEAAL